MDFYRLCSHHLFSLEESAPSAESKREPFLDPDFRTSPVIEERKINAAEFNVGLISHVSGLPPESELFSLSRLYGI